MIRRRTLLGIRDKQPQPRKPLPDRKKDHKYLQ